MEPVTNIYVTFKGNTSKPTLNPYNIITPLQNLETVKFTLQSTHLKWVFIASAVAVLGTEHTNKVFLLYKRKDKMTDQSGTGTGEYLRNIIKHFDLVRLIL